MPRDLRARSGRPSLNGLATFVDALPAPSKLLGLTHVTSTYLLREILAAGAIVSHAPCPVIGEMVSYTFYGRAAFRGISETQPATLACLFPSVLVIDPHNVPRPKYVFGFDTGAFVEGLMDQYLHPYMPLFDFQLSPTPVAAAKIVNAVFSSNDDYFRNRAAKNLAVPPSNFEADSYRQIVLGGGSGPIRLDDRCSTPELIFDQPIDLQTSVRAAVIPDTLASDAAIGGALKSLGVRIYEYVWTTGSRPSESHFVVRQIIQSVYGDFGWL